MLLGAFTAATLALTVLWPGLQEDFDVAMGIKAPQEDSEDEEVQTKVQQHKRKDSKSKSAAGKRKFRAR